MKPLDPRDIRGSIVNASHGEIERMPLPGLHEVMWESREYLGWLDPQAPGRGYLVHWTENGPVGVTLRASTSRMNPGISAMCSLCRTAQPGDQVRLFSAPRAGQAGREGNTVGTYICADLACSIIIRITPPASPIQPDPAAVVEARAVALLARVQSFTAGVMKTA
ncbi:FBP domain-containing protein [Marisediminicola sp. LYQ134]|uniref:FBP domain-containing protein n=1 Tax=unclassified Marisediminicola TaxID=2618316 RepID=UPI00398356A1